MSKQVLSSKLAVLIGLGDIPSKLKPKFKKILDDTKAKKDNLERS
jgi:hypothetical protein